MTAPNIRTIDALSGQHRPSKFFAALAEVDAHLADAADLEALRAENVSLRCRLDELQAERDELAETLREFDEAHQITLGLLARARRDLEAVRAERDSWRAAASAVTS